jgi:hypothetical protein
LTEATRDAFRSARASTALVHAWVPDDDVDAGWLETPRPEQPRTGRLRALLTWLVVMLTSAVFVALLVEAMVVTSRG